MGKNFVKILLLGTLLFFGAIFINISDAKAAECDCYYMDSSDYTNSSGINTSGITVAQIRYSDNGYEVVKSCESSYMSESNGKFNIIQAVGQCSGVSLKPNEHFNVDYKSIANSCSVSSCDSANIYQKGLLYLTTDKGGVFNSGVGISANNRLKAVEKKVMEKAIENSQKIENGTTSANISNDAIRNGVTKATNPSAGRSNCDLVPQSIRDFLGDIFTVIQVLGVILLIVLSMIEFVKALTASEEDGLRGALKNTVRRIIVVIILLLLPMIIIWAIDIANDNRYEKDSNGSVKIGGDGNPICLD